MRPRRGRRNRFFWLLWVVPLCLFACVAGLLVTTALPGLVLRVVGFSPQGSVDEFWSRRQSGAVADAPGMGAFPTQAAGESYSGWFQSTDSPGTITLDTGGSGRFAVDSAGTFAETVVIGESVEGDSLGVVEYSEEALDDICAAWLNGCATEHYRVQRVDFRPQGAILYGSVNLGGLWQEAGIALVVTPDRMGFEAAGVVFDGMLYAAPTQGEIAELVHRLVTEGNAALHRVRVQAGDRLLALAEMQVTDDRLTLILR